MPLNNTCTHRGLWKGFKYCWCTCHWSYFSVILWHQQELKKADKGLGHFWSQRLVCKLIQDISHLGTHTVPHQVGVSEERVPQNPTVHHVHGHLVIQITHFQPNPTDNAEPERGRVTGWVASACCTCGGLCNAHTSCALANCVSLPKVRGNQVHAPFAYPHLPTSRS